MTALMLELFKHTLPLVYFHGEITICLPVLKIKVFPWCLKRDHALLDQDDHLTQSSSADQLSKGTMSEAWTGEARETEWR